MISNNYNLKLEFIFMFNGDYMFREFSLVPIYFMTRESLVGFRTNRYKILINLLTVGFGSFCSENYFLLRMLYFL